MHALVCSDLHGNILLYELLLRVAAVWRVSSIFLAGDLAPPRGLSSGQAEPASELTELQRRFFRREFIPLFESFFHDHRLTHVYAIQGNDDARAVEGTLREFDQATPNFHLVNDRIVELKDSRQMHAFFPNEAPLLYVAGYPFVPPGAGLLMDWVQYENRVALRPAGVDPCSDLFTMGIRTVDEVGLNTIADDLLDYGTYLTNAGEPHDYLPERTIHLFHSPPYDTALDWVPPGGTYQHLSLPEHIGSSEIRRFIERAQPYLVLCGHCHESVTLGDYHDTLGSTTCINPGSQTHIDVLSLVQFDVFDPTRKKHFFINAR